MQTFKPMALGLSTRCIEHRRRHGLCVTAFAYFPFFEPGQETLWTEASMWSFLAQQMPEGPLIDEGVIKGQPEFLVHGSAYAPEGPTPACAVRARVGSREKTLLVFGDRQWIGDDEASKPVPFEQMALQWSRAYGGPAYAANPLGQGHAPPARDPRIHPLPNIEWPSEPLQHRKQIVAQPAGFGMLDPMWPLRAQYRGTYGDDWFKNHSPGFAADIDWRYFNLAPLDQRFDAALAGDEAFVFDNMHPRKPTVRGRLPGIKVRCFLNYRTEAGDKLKEVGLQLKTLWFFPHAERGVMLFQGMATIADEEAADVQQIMLAAERLHEPKPDTHYLRALQQRSDPHSGHLHALRDSDLLPEGLTGSDPEFDATQSDYRIGDLIAQAQYRNAEVQVERLRQKVRAQGMDPDELQIRMPPREPVPTLEQLPDYVEKTMKQALEQQKASIAQALKRRDEAMAFVHEAGIDPATLAHRGPPQYSARAHLQQLTEMLAGTPEAASLSGLAPKLMQAEWAAREGYRMSAHLQPPAVALDAALARELEQQVRDAHSRGHNFVGSNLTGASLAGLDLRGADFSGAFMESVDLGGADVSGARFVRTVLAHARLSGLKAIGADFTGCNLGGAKLAGAVFDDAVFTDAIFMKTSLAKTSMRGAVLKGTNLLETTWGHGDWSGCMASDLHFIGCKFEDHVFAGANLARATFVECDLSDLDLRSADLSSANFVRCAMSGARLSGACLAKAVFVQGCDLSRVDLTGASMTGVNLRGARLPGATLAGARLEGADLSEADLSRSSLDGASADGVLMMKICLTGATAIGASLRDAILQRADLRGTDLSRANLFGADLSRVLVDSATRLDGSLFKRVRTHPRRDVPSAA